MKIFASLTQAASRPAQIHTMQDVWDWIVSHAKDSAYPKKDNPHGFRLQYLTTLQSHCGNAPLSTIPADLAAFDRDFPKVRAGKHPRPDLHQDIEPYKKWRRNARKAIEVATGVAAEKEELRARQDGWKELLDAFALHTGESGGLYKAAASPVAKLADIARRAGIEPWDLAKDGSLHKLEAAFATPVDRTVSRAAQKALNTYAYLPEVAALLPKEPVPVFPTLRQRQALPDHIDAFLVQLVDCAGAERDKVSGKDSQPVSDDTKKGWLAALRHHVRTLPRCPADPLLGYDRPVTDLTTVNDVASLFDREHLFATLRHTEAVEHLPDTLTHVSAYDYYGAIKVVLKRNDLIDGSTLDAITNCKFMREGKQLAKGMTAANEAWCAALVRDPMKRKRFRNMHKILMAKANEILDVVAAESRELTDDEITKLRQIGTCAAACAIEYAGRPIRMANCLGLRLKGSQRNFFTPGKGRPGYAFFLAAHETKSGKKDPNTSLKEKMGGPQVMAWYLAKIRPLFPHHAQSIYLFPAVKTDAKPMSKGTFDTWFQRAAAAAGLPMTFHKWRHGYASILLSESWENLAHAAQMLGNTPGVCARNYGWIDKEKLVLESQNRMYAIGEVDH